MSLTITVKSLLWGFFVAAIVSTALTTQVYAKFNVIVFLADDLGPLSWGVMAIASIARQILIAWPVKACDWTLFMLHRCAQQLAWH